jgi:hypothetical protein
VLAASVHSRAVRRATSPGIDLDKSLKDVKPPSDAREIRPSVLAIHQGAGITKKSKHGRKSVVSARAARRKEKGMDRAEAFMDKKEKKVEKSKGRSKNVQDRSKAWEVQNKAILEIYAAQVEEEEKQDALKLKDDEMEETLWEDVDSKDTEKAAEVVAAGEMADAPPIPLPDLDDEDF